MTFDKVVGQLGKDNLFSKWCWYSLIFTCKMKWTSTLNSYNVKIIPKCILDLDGWSKTTQQLEENIGEILGHFGLAIYTIWHNILKKEKSINKLDFIKSFGS